MAENGTPAWEGPLVADRVAVITGGAGGVKDTAGNDIKTDLLPGGQSATLNFTIAQPGDYTFICDVHPVEMKGTLTVAAEGAQTAAAGGGGGAGGGQAGPGTIVQIASDNKFALTALNATANQQTSLTLRNTGQALHNVQVQGVQDTAGKPVQTDLLPAGQSATIQFTIAQAGPYNFICSVHPTEMKGTLTVK